MARPLSRTVPYRWSSLLSVVLNQRADHPVLRDANTRTGLLAAIDRSALLTKVLEGRGTIAELPVPDWSPRHSAPSEQRSVTLSSGCSAGSLGVFNM